MANNKDNLAVGPTVDQETGEVQISKSMAGVRAEIEGAIVSARHFPRNELAAYNSILNACKNVKLAEVALYKFPRGGATIEGPSINLAREQARMWGNIRSGLDIIADNEDIRTIEGWAWDVQTNSKVTAQDTFKKLIYRKKGGWIKPDERDLRELTNRRGAILKRNCILELIPRYITDEAMATCKKAMTGAVKDPKAAIKKIVKSFDSIGVTVEMIEKHLGHSIDTTTAEDIVDLTAIGQSIKDGNSTRGDHFDIKEDKTTEGNGSSEPSSTNGTIKTDDLDPEKSVEPPLSNEKLPAEEKPPTGRKGGKAGNNAKQEEAGF